MRRVAAVALVGVLALTACAVPTDPSWKPPAWPAPHVTVVDAPAPVDAASVPALVGERIRNDEIGIQSRWMRLPGVPALEERTLDVVKDAISRQETATGISYAPQVFDADVGLGDRDCVVGSTLRAADDILADAALGPAGATGTAVTCDIVVATGAIFGQRVRTVTGSAGEVTADTAVLLYTDLSSGEVVTAAELWREGAAERLWEDTVDAIRRERGSLSLAPVSPPDDTALTLLAEALAATVPATDGSLVVTVPAGFIAPELAALGVEATVEPIAVAVAPPRAADLLTPFGTALVDAVVAGTPFAAPERIPQGKRSVDCTLVPCVSLTYDDGPSEWTWAILDAAAVHDAALTFFALGQNAAAWRGTIARASAEGHLVENHTWNHPDLTTLEPDRVKAQIVDTTAALQSASGVSVRAFRPPYGEWDRDVLEMAGLPAILWDVDTLDWQQPADDELIRRAVEQPRPGSIVLQHDIHGNTGRTVDAVMSGLRDRGFSLVTAEQLFGGAFPAQGAWQSAR